MKKYTTITTNKETADSLEKHIKQEQRMGVSRSFELMGIRHETNHSVIVLAPAISIMK